jgi:hypothetical protein
MEKGLRHEGANASLVTRAPLGSMDRWLRSLDLLNRGERARRMVDLAIRGIEIEPIPPCLGSGQRAILVSNYPSIPSTLRGMMKVLCRLPGEQLRLKAIGRAEAVDGAGAILKALGFERLIFPAQKDEVGVYRLNRKVSKEILAYLDESGHLLWLSMTGRTRGNGLLEADLRTGAAQFSIRKAVPLVPVGLVTSGEKAKLKVVRVRFGEPINPPQVHELDEFDRADLLIDFSRVAMCQIARLLPAGQRGDFDNADEKLAEATKRLSAYAGQVG